MFDYNIIGKNSNLVRVISNAIVTECCAKCCAKFNTKLSKYGNIDNEVI